MSFAIEVKPNEARDIINVVRLNMIDVSCDSILSTILDSATDKSKNDERTFYYSVWMNRYKKGTMVRVIQSRSDVFDRRSNILGYTIVNDQFVVFYEGVTDYHLKCAHATNELPFKLGKFNYNEDTDDVKYYYILGDIYARFSPHVGWIWSDGKPDE